MSRRLRYGHCLLCKRASHLTFHHLIPRKLHKRRRFAKHYTKDQLNEGILLCPRCHKGLHALKSEMELGSRLNSIDAISADPDIVKHVTWVAKQKI